MDKIKNIEILRIIGCISVILFHLFGKFDIEKGIFTDINIYSFLYNITQNWNKAVELFFIISGVFFAITYNPNYSIFEFIKKKLIRLYPVLVFSFLIAFVLSIFKFLRFKFYNNLLGLFLLSGTPLALKHDNVINDWYVGALFWTLLLFFYLKKNFSDKYTNLFITIGIFFSYSIILHFLDGKIDNTWQGINNIINYGMLRAIGGIGIGYLIGTWYRNNKDKIKNFIVKTKLKICFTLINFLCFGFIVKNLLLYNLHFNNQIIFVLVFTITIMLLLLNKDYLSNYLNKNIFVSLSKYTYSLFLTHHVIIIGIKGSLWKYAPSFVYAHPIINIAISLLIIFIAGILTYHFIEKPSTNYLKKYI